MIEILEILVSLIFFGNKVFILLERKFGWLLGVVAAALAVIYFYRIELQIYMVLEASLVVLMGYGYFKRDLENPRVEFVIRFVIMVVMLVLAMFAYNGLITMIELLSSFGMLWGTYFLTHKRVRWGWILYGVAHLLAARLGYQKDQDFFADFQLASAIVSFIGASKKIGVTTKEATS